MTNVQILLAVAGVFLTFMVTLWGITERNTTRLIEAYERRMTERDEKLLAKIESATIKIEAVSAKLDDSRAETREQISRLREETREQSTVQRGETREQSTALREETLLRMNVLREEILAKLETVQFQLGELKTQNAQRLALEKEVASLAARVEQLEIRRAA